VVGYVAGLVVATTVVVVVDVTAMVVATVVVEALNRLTSFFDRHDYLKLILLRGYDRW
jgi:hypothetical protein